MKQLKSAIKNLLTSCKQHDDEKVEFLNNLLRIKPSAMLANGHIRRVNCPREKRYLNYMLSRIHTFISQGKIYTSLYILVFLMNKSQSFKDYQILAKPTIRIVCSLIEFENLKMKG